MGRRHSTLKIKVSSDERAAIKERARGYSSLAAYARRTLLAGWSLPLRRLVRITDAFITIQRAIDLAEGAGHPAEAQAATAALRTILATASEP